MKEFKLNFNWDRLRQGDFPSDKLKDMDSNLTITKETLPKFKERITIQTLIDDNESDLEIAYELGAFIHSLQSNLQA